MTMCLAKCQSCFNVGCVPINCLCVCAICGNQFMVTSSGGYLSPGAPMSSPMSPMSPQPQQPAQGFIPPMGMEQMPAKGWTNGYNFPPTGPMGTSNKTAPRQKQYKTPKAVSLKPPSNAEAEADPAAAQQEETTKKERKSRNRIRLPPDHLWKTKMCMSGLECKFGDRCWFAHTDEELRNPSTILPKNWKTAMCRSTLETGECKFGENCWFAHNDEELRTPECIPCDDEGSAQESRGRGGMPDMANLSLQEPAASSSTD